MRPAAPSNKGEEQGQKASKENDPGHAQQRRQKDHEFILRENVDVVDDTDSLDDCPSGRGRATSSSAKKHKLKHLDRTPLSLSFFDEDDKAPSTRLLDLKGDLVGHKSDWKVNELRLHLSGKLQSGVRPLSDGSPARERLRTDSEASPDSPAPSIHDDDVPIENDFSHDGSCLQEMCSEMPVMPCDNVGAFEECPSECEEPVPAVPVPKKSTSIVRKVKPERVRNECMLVVKKLADVMAEHPELKKPIRVKIRARRPNTTEITETIIQLPVADYCREELMPYTSRFITKKDKVTPGTEDLLIQAVKRKRELEQQKMKENQLEEESKQAENEDLEDSHGADGDHDEGFEEDLPDFLENDFLSRDACALRPSGDTVRAVDAPEGEGGEPTYEDVVRARIKEFHSTDFKVSELQKRVQEWEAKIRPILEEEEETREVFDIRTYSTRLLDKFSNSTSKQTLSFQHICQGARLWEVPRYFTASLQLANNYNIQLTKDGDLEKGMDTLRLTLLSRKQYFEELEEFSAPSSTTTQQERRRKQAKRQPLEQVRDVSDVLGDSLSVGLDELSQRQNGRANQCRDAQRRTAHAKIKSRAAALAMLAEDSFDAGELATVS
ncbi:condensin-2 complex subunit H2-like isoform X2 [Ornithodoros turicata]|uniref:condensin-2 complex subunit H2-like isoform X2 n=1 Tax=Ornithodoros turicata TaxID=34597 RepID=UPI003139574C